MDRLKEKCTIKTQKFKVQFDLAMQCLMKWNKKVIFRAKDHVLELFKAIDLDGNGYIELIEFIILIKCIEGVEAVSVDRAVDIFEQYANLYQTDYGRGKNIKIKGLVIEKFT
mmetsp:Transcript_25898/g.25159  ORF Transcript_25898/g.25159 Transcript_25898/m.25159 type:complete len:112 (-) Transcript_25898:364-699(-)|eukprot:CAMPEP_0170559882 /NCGR_PEP_ID=MMETSP0211-20121228/45656_1 /TAXON_ID=311385 /ORGANISM="Pseudokeronopsis sp., Strain OXSARD2" /LENGTH=111 /DNA_ID=CAMNT_0010873461 /DNA_START=372 /DNA_END=707 /DNA_ORIENTATION=+